ncbi:aromatic amino acid aminotransferase 1 [Hortaea werneckii]|nr:aromatic amino acid aminotransferase 1 [Hortaea werneckii]KAI7323910.1 aromatic amino acid aminotransferase 1 [Hortaea werneckii]
MAENVQRGSHCRETGRMESNAQTQAAVGEAPLTIRDIFERRTQSPRLVAGVAAVADVDSYKIRPKFSHKPMAKRWDHKLTEESKCRKGSSLKNAAQYLKKPGLISLGGGFPSSEYFPFAELHMRVPSRGLYLEPEVLGFGSTLLSGKQDMQQGTSEFDLSVALNYGQGHGSAQLLRWVTEHTELVHNPPYQDWHCTLTIGSTSTLDMALRMLTSPGHWMLSEEFTFPTAVETALPMGVKTAAVGMDSKGMRADLLDEILTHWDERARGGPKPSLLYTVPTGQNPTGLTQPLQRRKDLYAVACKHDLIILEDEPYYFMQMPEYDLCGTEETRPTSPTPMEFLASLVPSYLSIDVDGRVIRMDSFSKTLAPGSRIGWITASRQLVERYRMHADFSTQSPSGFSQLILFKLLDEHWGHEGYLEWLLHVRKQYTERRNVMLRACEKFLPTDFVRWIPPSAGMFLWLQVEYMKHPEFPKKSILEIEDQLFHKLIDCGVLLIKGSWFCGEKDQEVRKLFFRATYAAAPAERIEEAMQRFGLSLEHEFTGSN